MLKTLLAFCVLPLSAQIPLATGTLPRAWITGGPKCIEMPDWQVHAYNDSFYILRESGCTNYEKPFLYLIFGSEKVMLVDTGAGPVELARLIQKLRQDKPLLVTHSHGHGDHVAGDAQLAALPQTTVVAPTPDALKAAFHIASWPDAIGSVDLGGRVIDVIPIPGHQEASVAYYDRQTGILLSGDSLYPGRLYVNMPDFPAFLSSTRRMVEFTRDKPVAHILGAHIEQSSTPFVDYPVRTTYQPQEHVLELGRGHLLELLEASERMKDHPVKLELRDITIAPRAPRTSKKEVQ
jgi:hydroxyacylglutathione hydrolase